MSRTSWFNYDFEQTIKQDEEIEVEHLSIKEIEIEARKEPEKRMGFGMIPLGLPLKKVEVKKDTNKALSLNDDKDPSLKDSKEVTKETSKELENIELKEEKAQNKQQTEENIEHKSKETTDEPNSDKDDFIKVEYKSPESVTESNSKLAELPVKSIVPESKSIATLEMKSSPQLLSSPVESPTSNAKSSDHINTSFFKKKSRPSSNASSPSSPNKLNAESKPQDLIEQTKTAISSSSASNTNQSSPLVASTVKDSNTSSNVTSPTKDSTSNSPVKSPLASSYSNLASPNMDEPAVRKIPGLDKKMGFGNILANGFSLKKSTEPSSTVTTNSSNSESVPLQRLKSIKEREENHFYFVHLNPLLLTTTYYENISQILVTSTHCFVLLVNVKPIQKMQFTSQIKEFCSLKKITFVDGFDEHAINSAIKDPNSLLKINKILATKTTLTDYAPKLENSKMYHNVAVATPATSPIQKEIKSDSSDIVIIKDTKQFLVHEGKPNKQILNQYPHCFITTPIGHFVFIKRQKTSAQTMIMDGYKEFLLSKAVILTNLAK
eukprot:NODE_435_length_8649_cov_0.394386.p2 type:complete len:550 gc:universal NODE_435_length_8649_cov_0.394386:1989-340(-)